MNRDDLEGRIDRLLSRLPETDPVAPIACAAFYSHEKLTGKSVNALIAILEGPREEDWRRKAVAALTLGHTPPRTEGARRAAKALARLLDGSGDPKGDQHFRRSSWACIYVLGFWVLGAVSGAVAVAAGVSVSMSTHGWVQILFDCIFGAVVFAALLMFPGGLIAPIVSGLLTNNRTRAVREAAAISLFSLAEPESVGALAGAATEPHGDLAVFAKKALVASVPGLREEHRGAIPRRTTADLCHLLKADAHATTILRALEAIGNEQALAPLESFALSDISPELAQDTERVRSILVERAQRDRDSSRLLRATEHAVEADELLRPAETTMRSDPAELLRPLGIEP